MKGLRKTEGMNPSGVEMIHTPISISGIRTDYDVSDYDTSYLLALSTLTDVAKEVVESRVITINHLRRLEKVSSDRQDYLEYDIDYLIYLIKEFFEYADPLNNWKMGSIANDADLHDIFSDKAICLYKSIINTCNNILINRYL